MDDVEEKILSYPHLSVEEQREIEAYVESNPEWAPLLQDVRSLEAFAADVQEDLPSNALLATYVLVQHLHPEGVREVPSTLQTAFSRLESKLEEDEALRREADAIRRRLKEVEAAVDPVAHFEELTGRALDEGSEAVGAETAESELQDDRTSAPSVLGVFLNLPLLLRRAAVGAVLLVGLYGGLYATSVATQSTLDRLAAVDVSDQVIDSYAATETRSVTPKPDTLSVDDLYLEALSTLRVARTSTLGLFPRYDAEKLDQSQQLLKRVLAQVEPGSFLALEAHFYLGKVALAQGDVEAARSHFKTVVKREGRKMDEAHEILTTLQREGAGQGE